MSERLVRAAGLVVAAVIVGVTVGFPLNSFSEDALVPDVDYVQSEIIITFESAYAPAPSNFSCSPPYSGSSPVDSLFEHFECVELNKLFSTFNSCSSEAGQRLERTYLFRYEADIDAQDMLDSLSIFPYFERLELNRLIAYEPAGTNRMVPGDTTRFSDQWYFNNSDAGDQTDIDLPEAWAIEPGGDPTLVIGIFDEGTFVDTTTNPSNWRIHSDFNHYWNTREDSASVGILNGADLDGKDNDNDGEGIPVHPYAYKANIIGFNVLPGNDVDQSPGAEYSKRFWYGMPVNYQLCPGPGFPNECTPQSWEVGRWRQHGVWVASIAAAKLDGAKPNTQPYGKDIVGAAYNCKVYWGRFATLSTFDMAKALRHMARKARVINMSFGAKDSSATFADEIAFAADELGCVLIAATGNNRAGQRVDYPAKYADVLAVGALKRSPLELSTYSNWDGNAELVDVVAPVDGPGPPVADSFSDCFGPNPCAVTERAETIQESGTSFAAPQAAGLAALIRSRFPTMDQATVRARIKNSAQFYWEHTEENRRKYGTGKINAYRALTEWGDIKTNVVWDPDSTRDGTYYVSGDLTIESGGTLTINPGVLVRVAPDHLQTGDTSRVEIVVESGGRLDILGTASDPVRFESFTDSAPSDSDWVGITFQSGSHGILEHVVIDNATQDVEVSGYNISVADWDESKTLYLDSTLPVMDDLTVGSAETLYVLGESPVVVTGGSSIGIDVNGTLVCRGTTNDKPEFTATTEVSGAWDGIAFGDSSENNVLEHFIVRHALIAIESEVPLSIEDVTLSDGSEGIEADADLEVTTGDISDFTAYGVEVLKGHTTLTDVTITGCGMGIALGGYEQSAGDSTSVSATGCTIASPDFHGVTTSTYDHRHLALDETEITDAYYGVSLISATSADIRDCTLRRNDSGLLLLADPKAIAVRSTVIDTSTTSGVYCVNGGTNYYLGGNTIRANAIGVLCLNASPLVKNGNSITANTTGIKCDSGSSPVIEWNTISANTTGVWTVNGSDPDLGHATGGSSIGNNTFTGNTSYHVRHQTVSTTLMAENNWWGSSSGPDPGKISGSVDYDPYLTSAPASPPSPAPPAGEDREEELATEIPDRFDLSPGYPNPFNPSVTLRVQVPRPGSRVTVILYNVRGEAIRTLLDEYRAPGTHVLTWNGRTETGEAAATGVYFARMRSPGYVETRKIVLIK